MTSILPNLRFKFLRLLIGLPVMALGVATNFDGPWHSGYLLRCFFALIGAYIITRIMEFELCGIGFLIIGLPVFLCTMSAGSLLWLNDLREWTGIRGHSEYYTLKLTFRTIGACCVFAGLERN